MLAHYPISLVHRLNETGGNIIRIKGELLGTAIQDYILSVGNPSLVVETNFSKQVQSICKKGKKNNIEKDGLLK